jgi:tricorn protease
MGLLGARFSAHESGYFRIDSIIPGANWRDKWRSPLQDQGADVQEGEYILAINGRDLRPLQNIYEALIGTGGELVELTVNDEPEHDGARKVLVKTLESESSLYYYNWVETRREKVNKATDGRVGYIHLPNMVQQGLNMFARYYYPQLRKEGLIVDVRGNGGGNVSPMIIERLDRTLAMVNKARGSGTYPSPGATHVGPKACLLDRYTASDGDLFAYRFRLRELGPLVGERSWGGVVGIRGSLPLIDGGYLRKPEFAKYDRRGDEWIIEGHGVEPDIKVHNNPLKAYQGKDQQLQEAIKAVQERMEAERTDLPEPPPYPDKSRQQEAGEED